MRAQVAATDPDAWRSPELYQSYVDALDYETDLLGTLSAYRESVLRRVQWLDTGSSTAYDQWRSAEQAFRTARAEHETRYAGDVDLPAYNFTAADLGARARRPGPGHGLARPRAARRRAARPRARRRPAPLDRAARPLRRDDPAVAPR